VSAPFAPGVDAVSVLARHGVESCVDIAADSVERELAVRGTGRASVRRLTQLSGAGFWVSRGAVELAWEAFKGTDPRHAFKDDERELDGESVAEAESWYTAALRASELAAKLDGDIDFNSRPLRVDRPKRSAAWRIAFLKVATLHTLSSLCFEKWEETEFADASVLLDLLFAPAITGNDGPLSDADSPTVNGASIGVLRRAVIGGGAPGTAPKTLRVAAEYFLDRGFDPIVAAPFLDAWQMVHDVSYQGAEGAHRVLAEIVSRRLREKGGRA